MKSVYIASAEPCRNKVGISNNPKRRVDALSGAAGYPLRLVEVHQTPAARAVEAMAHWLLRDTRLHGEWFSSSVEDVRAAVQGAIVRVAAGEQVVGEPRVARAASRSAALLGRSAAAWRKHLTDEEAARIGEIDSTIAEFSVQQVERQMIANRAVQRARYEERKRREKAAKQ